jgi:hypothetical protein
VKACGPRTYVDIVEAFSLHTGAPKWITPVQTRRYHEGDLPVGSVVTPISALRFFPGRRNGRRPFQIRVDANSLLAHHGLFKRSKRRLTAKRREEAPCGTSSNRQQDYQ